MFPATQTYWCEPTGDVWRGLRRFSWGTPHPAGELSRCENGFHDASNWLDRVPAKPDADGYLQLLDDVDHAHPRWPLQCRLCSYRFADSDEWQVCQEQIYRRTDTGAEVVLTQYKRKDSPPPVPQAPAGACWDAWWTPWPGPDGIHLAVLLPDMTDWHVDSEASNCTRKGQPHECWVRHGEPKLCNITVDKNGDTCAAGAGSIASSGYHGFLRDGVLTPG